MRKLATQVPSSVSRLLQSTILQTPPTWYLPSVLNPPPIVPPRQTVQRSRPGPIPSSSSFTDLPRSTLTRAREGRTSTHKMKHLREVKPRPLPIVYPEDRIRRQFFRDFPFEAMRPTSLVEGIEIGMEEGISGREWTRLEQRGAYPTVENVIAFVLSLHEHHDLPLTHAYSLATSEFVKLRATHEMATIAAEMEARAHGAEFQPTPAERAFAQETKSLNSLAPVLPSSTTGSSTKYRKPGRWTASILPSALPSSDYSAGAGYVSKWRLPPPLEESSGGGELLREAASGGGADAAAADSENEEVDDLILLSEQRLGMRA